MNHPNPEIANKVAQESPQGVMPLRPIPVDDYTTFRAEFILTEGDIVFHFFPTKEILALGDRKNEYWEKTFPEVLTEVSKKSFSAEYPRIQAKRILEPLSPTETLDAWWFRAYGFEYLLDPHKFSYNFLDALDAGLDKYMTK